MGKRDDTYLGLWREMDRRSNGGSYEECGYKEAKPRHSKLREAWLRLGVCRVSVETWDIYLVGGEREM